MRKQEATNASKDTPHLQESGGRFAPGYKMSKQSLKSARQLKACMMQKMTAPPYEQATTPNGHHAKRTLCDPDAVRAGLAGP